MSGKESPRGGGPLFGYRYTADKHYEIDEHEAEAVRILFDMYNAGYGYLQIAKKLNGMGFRTRLGNLFGKNSLHYLLINRRYIGTAVTSAPPLHRHRHSWQERHDGIWKEEQPPPGS